MPRAIVGMEDNGPCDPCSAQPLIALSRHTTAHSLHKRMQAHTCLCSAHHKLASKHTRDCALSDPRQGYSIRLRRHATLQSH